MNEDKMDKILDRLNSIDITLAKQEISLSQHISRTELLEEQVKPLQERMLELKGAINLIKIVALLASIVEVIRLFHK